MADFAPMLCSLDVSSGHVLTRAEYMYELKLDGVRIVADKRGDEVSLTYRKARDATESYADVAGAVAGLPLDRVVLDGEIVAFDESGRPSFQLLGQRIQARGRSAKKAARAVPVVYVVFDVLAVGRDDVRHLPIEERKKLLDALVPNEGAIRLHPTFDDGKPLMTLCRQHRLEGVVAKKRGSRYRSGERTSDWIKVKCEREADLVVIGWTTGEGKRGRLGALDLGAYEGDRLVVRGSVGSGLSDDTIDALLQVLRDLEIDEPQAEGKWLPKKGRHFARPAIVVSVRHMGFTGDGLLRHPVYRGLRADVRPKDCTVSPVT